MKKTTNLVIASLAAFLTESVRSVPTVTTNVVASADNLEIIADEGGFDPGSYDGSTLGSCITFSGDNPKVFIDYDESKPITTVYLMGTMYQGLYNDIVGIEMFVTDAGTEIYTQCMDKVDGSGFYHCGATG